MLLPFITNVYVYDSAKDIYTLSAFRSSDGNLNVICISNNLGIMPFGIILCLNIINKVSDVVTIH